MSKSIEPHPALIAVRCVFLKVSAPLTYRALYQARIGHPPLHRDFPFGSLLVRYGPEAGQWKHCPREWFTPCNARNDAWFGLAQFAMAA